MKSLFTPYNLAGRRLANRVALAPMTRSRIKDTIADDDTALYYAQRASAGLLVTECIAVSQEGLSSIIVPGLWSDAQVAGWKKVTKAVHDKNGVIFAQIWHAGRVSHTAVQPNGAEPVGPSGKSLEDKDFKIVIKGTDGKPEIVKASKPRGLKTEEMPRITADFVKAAENAMKAGFDGVELHGANGYLFEQFFNPTINDRSDKYGGSVENRLRFFIETLDAVIAKVGASNVAVRLSPFSTRLDMPAYPEATETYLSLGRILGRRGLAYVSFNDECPDPGCRTIPDLFVRHFRQAYRGTLVLAGSLTQAEATRMMNHGAGVFGTAGMIDIAAFGRPYISNPDLVERMWHGWPLAKPDTSTFFGGDSRGYTDYPAYVPAKPEAKLAKGSAGAKPTEKPKPEPAPAPKVEAKPAPKPEPAPAPKVETKPAAPTAAPQMPKPPVAPIANAPRPAASGPGPVAPKPPFPPTSGAPKPPFVVGVQPPKDGKK